MEQKYKMFFALISSQFTQHKLSEQNKRVCSQEIIHEFLELAKKHDILHLLALGLKENDLLSLCPKDTRNAIFKAVYRYERLNLDFTFLCDFFEKENISFVPLKGSMIRNYYPEPWMRTSGDVDILVHEDDLTHITEALTKNFDYEFITKDSHVVMFRTPRNVYIELHYNLLEECDEHNGWDSLLNVWNAVTVRKGLEYFYEMPDDLFYFYHIAHMAKHFENGGCGIRPFIDLWILDRIDSADMDRRDGLLQEGRLFTFANVARRLSRVWFDGEEHDAITQRMEAYILSGGVYGNSTNRIMVQQQQKGGRIKYALSKIFIPYDVIKFQYPILQKHRWLTPIMEARRWCRLIFCGHLKRTAKELKYNIRLSSNDAADTQNFLRDIGLWSKN